MPQLTPEQIAEFKAAAEADNLERLPAIVAACEEAVAAMQRAMDEAEAIIHTDNVFTNQVRDVATQNLRGMIPTLTANIIDPYKARVSATDGE